MAGMIERLVVDGFRRLCDVDLEMRPLGVVIGPNGSGKTSLLEVLSLLSASARGLLRQELTAAGGFRAVLTQSGRERLWLRTEVGSTYEYHLNLTPSGTAYAIAAEVLLRRPREVAMELITAHGPDVEYLDPVSHAKVRPTWDYSPFETALAQASKAFVPAEEFRARLSSSTLYHALDVGPRSAVRSPQQLRPADHPGTNGEDLATYLYSLRETDRTRFETIEDTLRAGFAGFERLDFPPVAAGTISLVWRDRNFGALYAHQLSEGMLRFLWLVTLLQSKDLPALVMIDEPEVSLHPGLLSLLADLLREATRRTQILVATHSDRLVRFLRPDEVLAADLNDDGFAVFTWADKLDLESWLEDYSLDQIWQMGHLGDRT